MRAWKLRWALGWWTRELARLGLVAVLVGGVLAGWALVGVTALLGLVALGLVRALLAATGALPATPATLTRLVGCLLGTDPANHYPPFRFTDEERTR